MKYSVSMKKHIMYKDLRLMRSCCSAPFVISTWFLVSLLSFHGKNLQMFLLCANKLHGCCFGFPAFTGAWLIMVALFDHLPFLFTLLLILLSRLVTWCLAMSGWVFVPLLKVICCYPCNLSGSNCWGLRVAFVCFISYYTCV